jgi:hypothetical protein
MNQSETLRIVCPRQVQFMPIVLGGLFMVMLVPALPRAWARVPQTRAFLSLAVMLAMLVFVAGMLYRNLVFRDTLHIFRGEAEPRQGSTCFADEIVSIRRLPTPGTFSPEGKWTALGLGRGLIEIRTTAECFRFGVGLDEDAVDAAAERIAAFCGLKVEPG